LNKLSFKKNDNELSAAAVLFDNEHSRGFKNTHLDFTK
jgi:hypothetical protein